VTAFLVLLLFAVHVALNLYAASAVTAVAFDAASVVAGSDGGDAATERAEEHARAVLDRFEENGGSLDFEWSGDRGEIRLTVRAERPSPFATFRLPFQRIERTVVVRREALG
jgi:hypothetical protein